MIPSGWLSSKHQLTHCSRSHCTMWTSVTRHQFLKAACSHRARFGCLRVCVCLKRSIVTRRMFPQWPTKLETESLAYSWHLSTVLERAERSSSGHFPWSFAADWALVTESVWCAISFCRHLLSCGNYQGTETCMVRAFPTPQKPLQNHPSGYLGGHVPCHESLSKTILQGTLEGMSHATKAFPKPSFRVPWRACPMPRKPFQNHPSGYVGGHGWHRHRVYNIDDPRKRGKSHHTTTSQSGHPCQCQNCSQWPSAGNTGRRSLLNRPLCLPDDPIGQGSDLNWTELSSKYRQYQSKPSNKTTCTFYGVNISLTQKRSVS